MLWIIAIVMVAILASFLWTWVKNYERESAEAAHERIASLENQLEHLTERIEHLEAINTEISGSKNVIDDAEPAPESPIYRKRTRS